MKRWFSLIVIGMMILSGCTQQAEQKENPSSEAEPKEESVQEEELIIGLSKPMPDRVELPEVEEELKEKALHILHVELEDNVKARVMQPDGTYEKLDKRGKVLINSQEQFCAEAKAAVPDQNPGNNQRLFIPAEPAE